MKSWTVTIEQDGEDLILPFTPDMLAQVGWDFGDVLEWHDNLDGTWSIMKKQKLTPKFHEFALQTGGSHYPDVGGELLQKFGEMVVNECCQMMLDLEIKYPANLTVREIKKHFGLLE